MPPIKAGILLPVKGLDVASSGEFIDARATPNCQNVNISRLELAKRSGTAALGSSLAERVLGFTELKLASSTYFLRFGLTKVELLDKTTSVWSSVANTALTASASDRMSFAYPNLSGAKILAFTNGKDAIRKYTGTGNDANLGGSPPKAKFLVYLGGYLLLVNVTDGGNSYPSRVQWCDTGDIEDWSTGNAGAEDLLEDPEDTTGAALMGDAIAVHKEKSIYLGYVVSTSNVFRFDRKATGAGTICNATIQNLPTGEQIFLGRDGFHLFNGVSAPLIDSPIMDELREQMNPQYLGRCWSELKIEKDEYWCGIPIGNQTEPETVYKYNYRTGQVFKDTRTGICAVGKYENSTQRSWNSISSAFDPEPTRWNDLANLGLNSVITFGDSAGVTTSESSANADNAVAIDGFWESKDFTARDILGQQVAEGTLLRWQAVRVWARGSGTLTVSYSTDEGRSWLTAKLLTLSTNYPEDSAPLYAYFDVVSTQCRFRFRNATSAETFAIKKFMPEVTLREETR